MLRGRYFFLIVFLTLISGCKKVFYRHEVKEINFVNQTRKSVSLEKLNYSPLGMTDIATYGDYIFVTTRDPSGFLKVYDINKDKEIASLCLKGRAENEFISTTLIGEQIYTKEGDIILPLIDNNTLLKEVNITQSILRGNTVINTVSKCVDPIEGDFALLDNNVKKRFIYTRPYITSEDRKPSKYYYQEEDKDNVEIPIFKEIVEGDDRVSIYVQYLGIIEKHPSKNLMIQPLQNMKFILFFDCDNDNYFAIHQDGARSFNDKIVTNDNYNPYSGIFGDVAVSNDYFFVNYGENFLDKPDSGINAEILIFDWEGNYINGFVSEIPVHRLSYNESNQTLYCANIGEEKLFQIRLSDIMK